MLPMTDGDCRLLDVSFACHSLEYLRNRAMEPLKFVADFLFIPLTLKL